MKTANLFVAAQFILFGILLIAFAAVPLEQPWSLRVFGFFWMGLGLFIVVIAIQEHSKANRQTVNISPEPRQNADLVKSGLYQNIRHPIYTGVIVAALGVGLVHGNLIVMGIALVFIPFFTVKSMFEESLLQKRYPEYQDYMAHTGRFLPPINR